MAFIFDVGAHTGEDSAYYLQKGFSVVAVEALPEHVQFLRERFAAESKEGRFFLEPVAIGATNEMGTFYVHPDKSDWHTARPQEWRGTFTPITIPFVTFDTISQRYPLPHYIKVDIEESHALVIQSLSLSYRPPFVSFECDDTWEASLAHLDAIGYRGYQVIDQSQHDDWREPRPAREGTFTGARFNGYMSGLFGLDLPDIWVTYPEAARSIREAVKSATQWYDIHARL